MFSVEVLGCDGSYPGPGGAGSGYLITDGEVRVWLDAGPGTLANLQERVDLEDLDAVILTHGHVDHWSDVEHAAVAAHYVIRRSPLPVLAAFDRPPSLSASYGAALDWRRIGPESRDTVGPFTFTFSSTDHMETTLAVRMEAGGRSVAYSADTGPGWELSQLGTDIDLALCEATFLSDREGENLQHLSARQAGATAAHAGCGRLVITHLWPRIDKEQARAEAAAAFGGAVDVAVIGARYEL